MNGCQFSFRVAGCCVAKIPAITTNKTTIITFMITMAELKFADSSIPITSRMVTTAIAAKAKRLNNPACCGRLARSTCCAVSVSLTRAKCSPVAVIEDEFLARSKRQPRRYADTKILHKAEDITAPSGGDGSRTEGILQDQIPADDPGENLAECGIAVGISRTGDGNQGCEFRVAESGENAGDSSQDERKHNSRPGIFCGGRASKNKNSGANDRPDTKCD